MRATHLAFGLKPVRRLIIIAGVLILSCESKITVYDDAGM